MANFTPIEYARKVREMRSWQHRYLSGRDRSSLTLQRCKQLEAEVDALTDAVLGKEPPAKPEAEQKTLFS